MEVAMPVARTVLVVRLVLALVGAAVAGLALPGAAAAAPADQSSYLRLAHLSPDTPSVDVYLASVGDPSVWFVVPGVGYGGVTDYRALPVDTYTVSMRPAGAPVESPPVITTTLTTAAGSAYTVAGTGLQDNLGLTVLDDELGMPAAGSARIRVINGAATAPAVDLSIDGGPPIAEGVPFAGTTGYQTVPVGNWTVDVAPPGAQPTSLNIDIAANAVYSVLLLDRGSGFTAQLLLDSAGAAAVPTGGVDTGMGGTAGSPSTWLLLPAAVVGLVGLGWRLRRGAQTS
jgi:Domain of unknown function (DUF4397)